MLFYSGVYRLGRHIYAVGTNENIPRSVGVSVEKVKIGVFTLAGFLFGVAGVMGLLVGGLSSGFVLAVFMANAGGAWDNAKKMVEEGHFGGKGSDCHKATVVGDTVGDPFKDTSGPSLNILIKLMSMVSIVWPADGGFPPFLVCRNPLLRRLPASAGGRR
mgnify:CR=1 FL=1